MVEAKHSTESLLHIPRLDVTVGRPELPGFRLDRVFGHYAIVARSYSNDLGEM